MKWIYTLSLAGIIAAVSGCADTAPSQQIELQTEKLPNPTAASATPNDIKPIHGSVVTPLEPRSHSKVTGTATFTSVGDKVEITVDIAGATPGKHAFHIHENGDCSAPDATSAGGHFNPHAKPHGSPESADRHVGDFGNIEVNAEGKGTKKLQLQGMTLDSSATGVLGRAIIVHEKEDDFGQPNGNAGGRVACGVIPK